jgi:hypothetical protein
MLVCYLDESGTEKGSPIITVGGYVALESAWQSFERNVAQVFDSYGVRHLHGVEFEHRDDPYKRWCSIKQNTFVSELADALRQTVEFGVCFSVRKDAYVLAKNAHGLNRNESAYGFAFRGVFEHILRDQIVRDAIARLRASLSFVMESGCKNEQDVRRIFELNKAHPSLTKVMGNLAFALKNSTIALQMADFLAYQTRRYVAKCEANDGNYVPMSPTLEAMTDRIYYIDHVATGFYPTKPSTVA